MRRILVTGGCGFIGSHIIDYLLKNTDNEIVIFDKLNYASLGFDRLKEIGATHNDRVSMHTVDFTKPISDGVKKEAGHINTILHLGAETHVDRSISDPELFFTVNGLGTLYMLEYARWLKEVNELDLFLMFSTDEVMGSAPDEIYYKETDTPRPENPYAAGKLAGESIAQAYACTYKIPLIITRTMNVFSKFQFHEKFIPSSIRKIIKGEEIVVHATPDLQKAGSRFYISADNVAIAINYILNNGALHTKENRADGIYNIVGEKEIDNLTLIQTLHSLVKKFIPTTPDLKYKMTNFHQERPGHDLRYALDGTKLKNMGFEYPLNLESSLENTVKWYIDNPKWLGME